jgi:hypothetical protein
VLQPLKERRTRRLQTLFGTVEVAAPRFKVCHCRRSTPTNKVALFSPVCELLTGRCTPELERVQAELGARTSFRDAVRILDMLLPTAPATHESMRNRTHTVALRIEEADREAMPVVVLEDTTVLNASEPIVLLDGAYIRAVPGQQVRHFEAICGKVEQEGRLSRRFGFVRSVAEPADALLRAALHEQSWRQGEAVIAIRDGDAALPALVRSGTGGPVEHILDCWSGRPHGIACQSWVVNNQHRSRPCPRLSALGSTRPRPSLPCTASTKLVRRCCEPISAARRWLPSSRT